MPRAALLLAAGRLISFVRARRSGGNAPRLRGAELGEDFETAVSTGSAGATEKIGEAIGSVLRPGDVAGLSGELGSGKTTLIKGIAAALGSAEEVSSPTFAIVHRYGGRTALIHVDLYRIRDRAELADLDYDLLFDAGAVSVVEWASRFADVLPRLAVDVNLRHSGPDTREIRIRARMDGIRTKSLAEKIRKIRGAPPHGAP